MTVFPFHRAGMREIRSVGAIGYLGMRNVPV